LGLARWQVCSGTGNREFFQILDRPIHRCALVAQAFYQSLNVKRTMAIGTWFQFALGFTENVTVLQPGKQLRERHSQNAGNLCQILETDVLFAPFDLTNICPMKSADVGEFLLRLALS